MTKFRPLFRQASAAFNGHIEKHEVEVLLLEFVKLRMLLSGQAVPVWRGCFPMDCIGSDEWTKRGRATLHVSPTVWPRESKHYFRLNTGGPHVELRMSETLNFRGMWPQEIYVYQREFSRAIHKYVHETLAECWSTKRQLEVRERNTRIRQLFDSGKTSWQIAIETETPYPIVCRTLAWQRKKATGAATA